MKKLITLAILLIYYNIHGQSIDYDTQISPIFMNSCMPCHGGNNPSSGLDLTSYESTMQGSNGGPVISIGDYQNSILWQEISSGDMPNTTANNVLNIPDLTSEEVALIANWIIDLECMTMDCGPEYQCLLGECVCINDTDQDGICDENETSVEEIGKHKKVLQIVSLLGKINNLETKDNIAIYIYDDGSIEKRVQIDKLY